MLNAFIRPGVRTDAIAARSIFRENGAPGQTRTGTFLRTPDFESGASTNSATGATGQDQPKRADQQIGRPFYTTIARSQARFAAAACFFCAFFK